MLGDYELLDLVVLKMENVTDGNGVRANSVTLVLS